VGSDRGAVYAAAETIAFGGKQFRRDIGRGEADHILGDGEISQKTLLSAASGSGASL
jgi:hypothetical protein